MFLEINIMSPTEIFSMTWLVTILNRTFFIVNRIFSCALQWVSKSYESLVMHATKAVAIMFLVTALNGTLSVGIRMMNLAMRVIVNYLKIFNSIICFNAIYMVNMLMRFKRTTKMFFHYDAVDIKMFTGKALGEIAILTKIWKLSPDYFKRVSMSFKSSKMYETKAASFIGDFSFATFYGAYSSFSSHANGYIPFVGLNQGKNL